MNASTIFYRYLEMRLLIRLVGAEGCFYYTYNWNII